MLSEKWNQEKFKEVEYCWTGITCKYPPLTLQDRVFNPLRKLFREAEEQGKGALTHEELIRKAFEAYQKYERTGKPTYTDTVDKEFVEIMIEDAEELLLITARKEDDGETKYRLNHQILESTTS